MKSSCNGRPRLHRRMSLGVSGNIDLQWLEFVPHRVDLRWPGSDGLTNSPRDLLVHRLEQLATLARYILD